MAYQKFKPMTWNPYTLIRRLIRMGRLSSDGPQPHQSMGIMTPPAKKIKAAAATVIRVIWRSCDACGYSKIDGKEISRAKYQVEVEGGTLYLCGHHFRQHSAKILDLGYPVHDIEEKVAPR